MGDRRVGLVLSRQPGERILIGPEIAVTIADADNPEVTLSVVVPPSPVLARNPEPLERRELEDRRLGLTWHLRTDDRLELAEDISLLVVSVSGSTVKLGVDAPRSVQIYREEVYEEILRENRAAAEPAEISGEQELAAVRRLMSRFRGEVEPETDGEDGGAA